MSLKALSFKTETFGSVDGPGVRLLIFLQGCSYRCAFCHNPESWSMKSSQAKLISTDEIIALYNKNKSFYANGGITLSGGEPMLHLDFVLELAKKTAAKNIHLAIDTSGTNYDEKTKQKYLEIAKYVNLWIVDIKHINPKKHASVCGVFEQREIDLIKMLDSVNAQMWIRQVLVPGLTDNKNDLIELGKFLKTIKNLQKFELLPYHNLAIEKYKNLNMDYSLKDTPVPKKDELQSAMSSIREGMQHDK